jgi:hypothetical protein
VIPKQVHICVHTNFLSPSYFVSPPYYVSSTNCLFISAFNVKQGSTWQSYIPVQFIKSFCCIEAEKRVKKKLQGRLILTQGGRRGYSKISFVHRLGLFANIWFHYAVKSTWKLSRHNVQSITTKKLLVLFICTCFGITKLHTGTIHQIILLHRSWEKGKEKIAGTFNFNPRGKKGVL